jgi:hypothetical protein
MFKPKTKAPVKIIEAMFKTPRRVTIPEAELIVWMQNNLTRGKETLPGKWVLIAYRLPEEDAPS